MEKEEKNGKGSDGMKKRICMVVPNRMVKGGIAAVVNGYRGSQLEKDYEITYVESYRDGSKFDKLLKTIFYKGIMPSETGFRFSSGL